MSMALARVQFTGLREAIEKTRLLETELQRRIQFVMEWWGELVVQEMRRDHAYTDRTGNLTRSMGYEAHPLVYGKGVLILFANMWYAEAVEYGTPRSRPYPYFWPKIYQLLPVLWPELQKAVDGSIESCAW